jgi:hypothetical protein
VSQIGPLGLTRILLLVLGESSVDPGVKTSSGASTALMLAYNGALSRGEMTGVGESSRREWHGALDPSHGCVSALMCGGQRIGMGARPHGDGMTT